MTPTIVSLSNEQRTVAAWAMEVSTLPQVAMVHLPVRAKEFYDLHMWLSGEANAPKLNSSMVYILMEAVTCALRTVRHPETDLGMPGGTVPATREEKRKLQMHLLQVQLVFTDVAHRIAKQQLDEHFAEVWR